MLRCLVTEKSCLPLGANGSNARPAESLVDHATRVLLDGIRGLVLV